MDRKKLSGTKKAWIAGGLAAAAILADIAITYFILPPIRSDAADTAALSTQAAAGINAAVGASTSAAEQAPKPKVEVPYDLTVEENDQKSVDAGHSPWRLDPVFTAQVFASLKIHPEGITGEYPVKTEDLKAVSMTDSDAVIEVSGGKAPLKRVYLKRLIKQDPTGIWTVTGYDD